MSVTPGMRLAVSESPAKAGGSSLSSKGSLSPSLSSSSLLPPEGFYREFKPPNRGYAELNNDEPGWVEEPRAPKRPPPEAG